MTGMGRARARGSALTVGALARRTGLSVRALHHYDAIGLLTPSARTQSRYRLYGTRDVRRLQKIVMMRGLGLPLAEIARALANDSVSALEALELQLARLRERIAHERRLCTRLESLAASVRRGSLQTLDNVIDSIQEMTMFESTSRRTRWIRFKRAAGQSVPTAFVRSKPSGRC